MATSIHNSAPSFCGASSRLPSSTPPSNFVTLFTGKPNWRNVRRKNVNVNVNVNGGNICKAMVQDTTVQGGGSGGGPSAAYAREMERLSAKESLLIALKDAGGFRAVVTGKATEMQRIDVMERITGLERLNPTPRPTTSPYLEGRWNFEWLGSGSPAAQFLLERFPTTLANVSNMDLFLKDNYAKVTASLRLLSSVESKFTLSSKLSVEGPLRMKEEYAEGLLESPTVVEEAVPDQLRGALGQAASAVQQLPVPVKDALSSGLRIPLSGGLQRLFMISYLDEEIFIIRDAFGAPEVLTRVDVGPSSVSEPTLEYVS
ncbi:putative plastid-lipid-associated protein 13, chloroplastic [Silene latifolia]|uniref:putative plastid-lipid-associated protein 13, chloroplastic n=1 Tax=Silene latifolia TaxID=37657 RepID=UPI003D77ABA8